MPAPLGWVAPGRGVRVGPEPPYEEGALGKEVLREGCVSDFGKGVPRLLGVQGVGPTR